MSLREFAEDELRRAGMFDAGSDYSGMLGAAVMKMIEVFSEEEHSGFSADLAINLFERVARFEPLTPLTGGDDEWNECGEGVWQNRRCPHVFRDENGPYDIEGKIFRKPDGACFTSRDSRVQVTFPYVPKREYVDVPASS